MKKLRLVKFISSDGTLGLEGGYMRLVEFTKDGLIICALMGGPLRYKDLKRATGLSDAWLSKKLQELLKLGMVVLQDGCYRLDVERLQEVLRSEKTFIARMIAQEIVKKNNDTLAIILFGSLVRDSKKDADIDMLVITAEEGFNPMETSLEMLHEFSVAVDIVHITLRDLLQWLYDKPPILFGILSGYEILFDRGYIKDFIKILEKEVLKNWIYIEREKLWLKKESSPLI